MTTSFRLIAVAAVAAMALAGCNRKPETTPAAAAPTAATPAADTPSVKPEMSFDEARAKAKAQQLPLIVDFHAPWCYSCYFMATNILTGPQWDAVEKKAVVVEVDADSPDGASLQKQYGIKFLPSYLVLRADGQELGRILGEKTRAEFYPQINKIIDSGQTLQAERDKVKDGSQASVVAGRSVLKSYHARYDADGGLQWFAGLPDDARKALQNDTQAALWMARLHFLQAVKADDKKTALAFGKTVLAGDLGCERPYELDRYMPIVEAQPDAKTLIGEQQPAAQQLVEQGVFGEQPCADKRSAVFALFDIDGALGEKDAQEALLERAIADVEKDIGGDFKKDRNLDDNLRVYRDQLASLTGDYSAYDALMPQLVAAWPDDYVYPERWGKSLLERGKADEALPHLEQAAQLAYGANRLLVAELRVKALQALHRDSDARRVVAETLKANGPWFPTEAAKLKAMVNA
ncbi:thioredoxin family protein [Solimonas marina]|uniref:Thioredoxin domain-containing protein n=1 Tax=Solimonas marina TaxID=2714601 RepID=A0A969WC56_9GAMM|nr:thioredoxin family protein [Solimonas marina]NKF23848.1 hypothetical protein [Solimonas marina]